MNSPSHTLSVRVKLSLSACWSGACLGGATGVLVFSHISSSILLSPTRSSGLLQAQQCAMLAGALLLFTMVMLLALTFIAPVYKRAAHRVSLLTAGLLMTGLPLTLISLSLNMWFVDSDFRVLGAMGGLVSFFLWVRVVTECWRAAVLPWQGTGITCGEKLC